MDCCAIWYRRARLRPPQPRGWILIMSSRRLLAPRPHASWTPALSYLCLLWMSSLGVMKVPYYMPHPLVINYRCYLNTRCCQCALGFSALTSDGYLGLFSLQALAKIVSGDRCLLFKKPLATLSSAAIIAGLAGVCHYSALLNVKGGASCPAGCLPSSPKGQFVFLWGLSSSFPARFAVLSWRAAAYADALRASKNKIRSPVGGIYAITRRRPYK